MEQYKKDFIEFALASKALKFGDFTLKSGRKSPFFFNAGSFYTGEEISKLAYFYANHIIKEFNDFDIIFGPAYKGIPLAVATTSSLYINFKKNVNYSSNRKEIKDHGEKGLILGKPLYKGAKVLLIDDVVTSGISIEESISLLKDIENIEIIGLVVSVNRQEKSKDSEYSALDQISIKHNFKTSAIVTMKEIISYLKETHLEILTPQMEEKIIKYYKEYGAVNF
mgnify:FL=1